MHIMMTVTNTTNQHTLTNARIEALARKRKVSAVTFFIFGVLLVISGSFLASFEKQRFSVSFIVFGGIAIIFAFMYWISAEKILITMRKLNAERMRAQSHAQNVSVNNLHTSNTGSYSNHVSMGLPSYEQIVFSQADIPPAYEEAIKNRMDINNRFCVDSTSTVTPINTISFNVCQTERSENDQNRTQHMVISDGHTSSL